MFCNFQNVKIELIDRFLSGFVTGGLIRYQAVAARPQLGHRPGETRVTPRATSDKVTKIAKYSGAILSGLVTPVTGDCVQLFHGGGEMKCH